MKDCDFIPTAYHEARHIRRAIRRRVSLVSGLAAVMLIWVFAHQRELASASAMLIDVSRQEEQNQIHATKKAAMEEEQARLRQHEQLVEMLASRSQLEVVLSDLSRRLPESMVLTQLTVHAPDLSKYLKSSDVERETIPSSPSTAKKPPQETAVASTAEPQIRIAGIARSPQDAITFAAVLENSPLLDRVQIQSQGATRWAGRTAERFEITCDLLEQKERLQ